VVFFSWWQGLLISILASNHVLHATAEFSEDDVVKGLQDFVICVREARVAEAGCGSAARAG